MTESVRVIYFDPLDLVGFRGDLFQVLETDFAAVTWRRCACEVAQQMAADPAALCVVVFSQWLDALIACRVPLHRVHFVMHIGGGLRWTDFVAMKTMGLHERFRACAAVYSYIQGVDGTVDFNGAISNHFIKMECRRSWEGKPLEDHAGQRLCIVADVRYDPVKKNLFTIVRAWACHLKAMGFSLTIGGGHWSHWLRANGVPSETLEGICFLDQLMSPNEMAALYCASDIFVVDSTVDDGFPTTCAVEAMCCGCALVASDNQGQTRFVPEVHFVPFVHKDSDDMFRAIMRVSHAVAKQGCERVRDNWSPGVAWKPLLDRLRGSQCCGTAI